MTWPRLRRNWFSGPPALQAPTLLHPSLRANTHVLEALGSTQVEQVRLQRGSDTELLDCDRLACGFGLVPNTHLGQMLGCALGDRNGLQVDTLMRTSVPGVYAAGECTGFGGSERALVQGAMAGHAAAGNAEAGQTLQNTLARWNAFADALHRHFPVRASAGRPCPVPTPWSAAAKMWRTATCNSAAGGSTPSCTPAAAWAFARAAFAARRPRCCTAGRRNLRGTCFHPHASSTLASAAPDFIHEPMTESTSKA